MELVDYFNLGHSLRCVLGTNTLVVYSRIGAELSTLCSGIRGISGSGSSIVLATSSFVSNNHDTSLTHPFTAFA